MSVFEHCAVVSCPACIVLFSEFHKPKCRTSVHCRPRCCRFFVDCFRAFRIILGSAVRHGWKKSDQEKGKATSYRAPPSAPLLIDGEDPNSNPTRRFCTAGQRVVFCSSATLRPRIFPAPTVPSFYQWKVIDRSI
jgi:hypothetical protein